MTTLINTNPLGAIDLYVVGLEPIHLEAGDEFDVPDDIAASLLEQSGNYALKDGEKDPRPAAPAEEDSAPEAAPELAPVAPAAHGQGSTPAADATWTDPAPSQSA